MIGSVSTTPANRLAAEQISAWARLQKTVPVSRFDREFHNYLPGSIMRLRIVKSALESGIPRFELGLGDDPYKRSLMSDETMSAKGSVQCRPMAKVLKHRLNHTGDWEFVRQRLVSKLRFRQKRYGPFADGFRFVRRRGRGVGGQTQSRCSI